MSVNDVSFGRDKAAWLLDYKIDSSTLKADHRAWLDRNVVTPLRAEHARHLATGATSSDAHEYTIFIIGSASRTGSYDYNLKLSKGRANVVAKYLAEALNDLTVVFSIRTNALSELRAAIMGDKDETENMTHRAVFVSMVRHEPEKPPEQPKITPPSQAIAVDFWFYAERTSWFNVQKWHGEFYAAYKHKGERRHVGWKMTSSGATVGPGDINKGFTPPIPNSDAIFAGKGQATFPNAVALDRLNNKTIYPRVVGSTLTLRIVGAGPERDDLILKMPIRTGGYELSQAVGSLGRMETLNEKVVQELYRAIQATGPHGMLA